MNGLYAADPALTRVVSTPKDALHLHGYVSDVMLGGHVGSAQAISLTVTRLAAREDGHQPRPSAAPGPRLRFVQNYRFANDARAWSRSAARSSCRPASRPTRSMATSKRG